MRCKYADRAGFAVSGGFDVNGDGLSDFVIGAPEGGTVGAFDGEAYVIFGQVRRTNQKRSTIGVRKKKRNSLSRINNCLQIIVSLRRPWQLFVFRSFLVEFLGCH